MKVSDIAYCDNIKIKIHIDIYIYSDCILQVDQYLLNYFKLFKLIYYYKLFNFYRSFLTKNSQKILLYYFKSRYISYN